MPIHGQDGMVIVGNGPLYAPSAPASGLIPPGGPIGPDSAIVNINGQWWFVRQSSNWATPGFVSPLRIGTADLHDDDGQPWLCSLGWIAKSMDVGFRLETPNGTTNGGLIGFSTAPSLIYVFSQPPPSGFATGFAFRIPPAAPTLAHLAIQYGTAWVDEAASQLKFVVRLSDGTYKTATVALT